MIVLMSRDVLLRRASDRTLACSTRRSFFCSGSEAGPQLRAGQSLGVGRCAGLVLGSYFRMRAGVDRVEADLVDQLRHGALRVFVVARDRDAEPLGITGGMAVVTQAHPLDGVEGFDDPGAC